MNAAGVVRGAAWYGRRGLAVHPLRPGSKLPLLRAWQERATSDSAMIAQWWRTWPDAGLAIATGRDSGVIVLDVDPRHGGDDVLRDLEREHGELPATWRCLTPGGGVHAYFAHPKGTIRNRAGLWVGIDVRADGGYVCVPPTVLAGGRSYTWEIGHAPHEVALAPAPTWLLEALRAPRNGNAARPAADTWAVLIRDGVDAGGRNDTVARLAGHLLRRLDPYVVLELLRAWNVARCRPPLADDEVNATVDSICAREARRRGGG